MSIVRSASFLVPVLAASACLTAGAGPVHLLPGAEQVNIVYDATSVQQCTRLQDVAVSDGILRRQQNQVHPGRRARAHQRLRNVTVHEGGDTALIMNESTRVIPDPPSFKWTIKAVVYHCAATPAADAAAEP